MKTNLKTNYRSPVIYLPRRYKRLKEVKKPLRLSMTQLIMLWEATGASKYADELMRRYRVAMKD